MAHAQQPGFASLDSDDLDDSSSGEFDDDREWSDHLMRRTLSRMPPLLPPSGPPLQFEQSTLIGMEKMEVKDEPRLDVVKYGFPI